MVVAGGEVRKTRRYFGFSFSPSSNKICCNSPLLSNSVLLKSAQSLLFFNYILFLYSSKMSLFREACQQLRHIPKTASRTYLSRPAPRQSLCLADSSRLQLSRRNNAAWRTGLNARSFSVTARAQHGHLTPPKPGEE